MTTKEKTHGKLGGKIALITGGNSGIGLATAKQFVNEGAYVFITGRRDMELAAAVKEIGRNVTGIQGDVANLGDLDRLFAQIKREKGKLDIVFANAGGAKFAPLGKITEEHYDSIFNGNVNGLLFTVQKALPLGPDGASIILNASVAGSIAPLPEWSVYNATKAAVRSFERRFTLPQGMDAGKISAHYEHGVLELRVPLPAQLAGRKIPIQIEQKENKKKLESKVA
jgi:NAD(P)-dependent dehydrogenase (short-subunit alcohol dehydrogenase family)